MADPETTGAEESIARALAAGSSEANPRWRPSRIAVAPGRIELLGNHLDYNGGPVLAAAIDRFVAVAVGPAPTTAGWWMMAADLHDGEPDPVGDLGAAPASPPETTDYLRGVIQELWSRGHTVSRDGEVAIAGNVPLGFGVSSSAALCVSLTVALAQWPLDNREVVLIAQAAEHRAGSPCGAMDQSASIAGGVIEFDGASLSSEALAPSLGEFAFAVADSGVTRSIGTSSYPTRVQEGKQALAIARSQLTPDIPHLAAISPEQLEELAATGAIDAVLAKRVRHVVEETARVRAGRAALEREDWPAFGALMSASGHSSATLYDISHPEVEELVSLANRQPGVLGARMMGGGEGGAVLILLRRDHAPAIEQALRRDFYARRGRADEPGLIHICALAPGAALVNPPR
ncbi:MAG: galactokinase family protein [Thermomicrobiales bacterium]